MSEHDHEGRVDAPDWTGAEGFLGVHGSASQVVAIPRRAHFVVARQEGRDKIMESNREAHEKVPSIFVGKGGRRGKKWLPPCGGFFLGDSVPGRSCAQRSLVAMSAARSVSSRLGDLWGLEVALTVGQGDIVRYVFVAFIERLPRAFFRR